METQTRSQVQTVPPNKVTGINGAIKQGHRYKRYNQARSQTKSQVQTVQSSKVTDINGTIRQGHWYKQYNDRIHQPRGFMQKKNKKII